MTNSSQYKIPCAWLHCTATSDQRKAWGQGKGLNERFAILHPTKIKPSHEHKNKVCDAHGRKIWEIMAQHNKEQELNLLHNAVNQTVDHPVAVTATVVTPTAARVVPVFTAQPVILCDVGIIL